MPDTVQGDRPDTKYEERWCKEYLWYYQDRACPSITWMSQLWPYPHHIQMQIPTQNFSAVKFSQRHDDHPYLTFFLTYQWVILIMALSFQTKMSSIELNISIPESNVIFPWWLLIFNISMILLLSFVCHVRGGYAMKISWEGHQCSLLMVLRADYTATARLRRL